MFTGGRRSRLGAGVVAASIATAMLLPVVRVSARSPGEVIGQVLDRVVERGDTLSALAARFGVDPATIARDNSLAVTSRLVTGQRLRIDARHIVPAGVAPGTIVVNLPQRMLFLGDAGGIRGWPVAVGRPSWPTPLGPFVVISREEHPTWDVPASIIEEARRQGRTLPRVVPPGPNNPLGDHWLGLDVGGIGIHGTNAPSSIYKAVTHGCIRLHPDDIAELFAAVPVGTRGRLVYEPVLLARDGAAVVLEVHPDVYRRGLVDVLADVRARAAAASLAEAIDWSRVSAVIAERAGVPRTISVPRQDSTAAVQPDSLPDE